jgi:hypothetical protein
MHFSSLGKLLEMAPLIGSAGGGRLEGVSESGSPRTGPVKGFPWRDILGGSHDGFPGRIPMKGILLRCSPVWCTLEVVLLRACLVRFSWRRSPEWFNLEGFTWRGSPVGYPLEIPWRVLFGNHWRDSLQGPRIWSLEGIHWSELPGVVRSRDR